MGLIIALGPFFASFFMYRLYHVTGSLDRTPIEICRESFLSWKKYVANLVRRRSNGTVSCSRTWIAVVKDSGTAQLECSIIITRHDSFEIPVAWK